MDSPPSILISTSLQWIDPYHSLSSFKLPNLEFQLGISQFEADEEHFRLLNMKLVSSSSIQINSLPTTPTKSIGDEDGKDYSKQCSGLYYEWMPHLSKSITKNRNYNSISTTDSEDLSGSTIIADIPSPNYDPSTSTNPPPNNKNNNKSFSIQSDLASLLATSPPAFTLLPSGTKLNLYDETNPLLPNMRSSMKKLKKLKGLELSPVLSLKRSNFIWAV